MIPDPKEFLVLRSVKGYMALRNLIVHADQFANFRAQLAGQSVRLDGKFDDAGYEQYSREVSRSPLRTYSVHAQMANHLQDIPQQGKLVDWGAGEALYYQGAQDFWLGNLQRNRCTIIPIEPNRDALERAVLSKRVDPYFAMRGITQARPPYKISDNSVDAFFGISSLHVAPQGLTKQILSEAMRMLKPGGRFFHIYPFIGYPNFLSEASTKDLAAIDKYLSLRYPGLQVRSGKLDTSSNFFNIYGAKVGERIRDEVAEAMRAEGASLLADDIQKLPMERLRLTDIIDRNILRGFQMENQAGIASIIEAFLQIRNAINDTDISQRLLSTDSAATALFELDSVVAELQGDMFNALLQHRLDELGFDNIKLKKHSIFTMSDQQTTALPADSLTLELAGHTFTAPWRTGSKGYFAQTICVSGNKPV